MKKTFLPALMLLALLMTTLSSCLEDKCENTYTYTQWNPVYKTTAEMRVPPQYQAARPLKNTGKIYFYDKYILVNEVKQGIHVIDNSNPASPQNVGFISIVGNVDMAVKGDYLYADNYLDLITLDISTITNPKVTCRTESVFVSAYFNDPQRGFLVDYVAQKTTMQLDCNDPSLTNFGNGWWRRGDLVFSTQVDSKINSSGVFTVNGSTGSAPAGVGGSFARFTFSGNNFYAIDQSKLKTFSLNRLDCPLLIATNQVGWNIETIFPYKDKLFIGSTTGMFIYSVTNPNAPVQLSQFTHAFACDPVVVENETAFITLRGGTNCRTNINQLSVIDIKNVTSPTLIKIYPMKSPKGLSVWNDILYLCDEGLKIYDVKDKMNIDKNLKAHITGFETFDIIPYEVNNRRNVMVIGSDGLFQFDVTDPTKPKELSKISVVK
jgi:LVIVD repeat